MKMTENEEKFSVAALAVFKRYGARKATMADIAAEAGVSKPTLYATFKNKDAALGGAIRIAKGAALRAVLNEWEDKTSLSERLDTFFERLVLAGFDMLHASPDAAAFENALGDASLAAIDATRSAEIEAMATVLEGSERLKLLGTDARSFADFIVTSAMNAKRMAKTRVELEQYLGHLKISAMDAVDPSDT